MELFSAVDFIVQSESKALFSEKQIIEAMMSGIIRISFLGLTGFDTPGSAHGLEESKVAWKTLSDASTFFKNDESVSKAYTNRIHGLFEQGSRQLQAASDFNSFDRLSFYRSVSDPLYEAVGELRSIYATGDLKGKSHAQNYNSTSIFSSDFLDRSQFSYFTYLPLENKKSIALGELLFHDPIMSKNIDMSCASCHHPSKAFASGLTDIKTKREVPSLIDSGFATKYFWDMRSTDLERQVAHVVADTEEFNTDFATIAERLKLSRTYVQMFNEAYTDISKEDINPRSISNAIAAYVNSLVSFNSLFDQYMDAPTYWELPEGAKRGFNLFMGKANCGTCHFAPVFNGTVPPYYTETESEVLGITASLDTLNPIRDTDPGRKANGRVLDDRQHFEGSMKTVTVRNSALTAPYMHNGSLQTLREVLEFYNQGGGEGMGLEVDHQTLSPANLNLTPREQADIISFLHTLTDTASVGNGTPTLPDFEKMPQWNSRSQY
jgi:cytochrome c peroxidase